MYERTWIECFFFFNDTANTEIYTLSLHDALPIWWKWGKNLKHFSLKWSNFGGAIAWVSRWDLEGWQACQDNRALSRYSRSNMCRLSQTTFFLGLRNTHNRPYCEILNFAMMTVVSFFTVALVTHTQLTLRVMARQHRLWVLSADIWAHLHWLLEPYPT